MRIFIPCIAAIVLLVTPVAGQDEPQQIEGSDWLFQESADPFDDTRMTIVALLADNTLGIKGVGFRCDNTGFYLAVLHSYMGGENNKTRVMYRLGGAEPQTEDAALSSNNRASFVELDVSEADALRQDPRVAVRLTDPLDSDTHQEAWQNLAGTDAALAKLHCLPER